MCGIVGLVNGHPVANDLVAALGRLEYRGYDSAGLALTGEGALTVRKVVGRTSQLTEALGATPPEGHAGIAHTRWATHGKPEARNAHPHVAKGVAVVHNGIIANHAVLRAACEAEGAVFSSDTDSEVIPHLIAAGLRRGEDPVEAFEHALGRLEGAYAIAAVFEQTPDRILVARQGSPLLVGEGEHCAALASDAVALAGITDRVAALEDGSIASLDNHGVTMLKGPKIHGWAPPPIVAAGPGALGGSFTRQEISAQSSAIRATDAALKGLVLPRGVARSKRLVITACGSSLLASQVARDAIERAAGVAMECEVASEFADRAPRLSRDSAVVLVSQSGETADTMGAMRHAEAQKRPTIGVVNVPHSAMGRGASVRWPTSAGPEVGVAATKSFTSQLMALLRLGMAMDGKDADLEFRKELDAELATVPAVMEKAEACEAEMKQIAMEIATEGEALFLGRGACAALAGEAALKLKELSYIRAEGYAAGEMKHGPIALVRERSPVVVFAGGDAHRAKTLANAQAVRARGARVTVIVDEAGAEAAREVADRIVVLPGTGAATWFAQAVALQLLSVHTAEVMGRDVDRPRNLAKSVTVE